jgi:hypothetical protein
VLTTKTHSSALKLSKSAADYHAFGEFQLCRERIGEALSMYLNDRPSYRSVKNLEDQIQLTNALLRGKAD